MIKNVSIAVTRRFLPIFIGLVTSLTLIGCAKNRTTEPAKPVHEDGTSSGGGGFGDENSLRLLKWATQLTAASIRQANPLVFQKLPAGWTAERLARLIENVRVEANRSVYRYNRELMLDYKVPASGEPYLIATNLFVRSHASVPVDGLDEMQIEPYLREIRTMLLHEAAHVLGIGTSESSDFKARVFAEYVAVDLLEYDNVICSASDVPDSYYNKLNDADLKRRIQKEFQKDFKPTDDASIQAELDIEKAYPYIWVLSRTTGFGLESRKSVQIAINQQLTSSSWVKSLLNGQPISRGSYMYTDPFDLFPNRGVTAELPRYFAYAIPDEDTNGLTQQYFPEVNILAQDEGAVEFKGSTQYYSPNERDKKCGFSEELRIPMRANGNFSTELKFDEPCHQVYVITNPDSGEGKWMDQPVTGSIALQCVESFAAFDKLEQFLGEKPFTDKEFLKLQSWLDKLD